MAKVLFLSAVAMSVVGCRKAEPQDPPKTAPAPTAADAGAAAAKPVPDAAPAVDEEPAEEDALRKGKKTGLGAADEDPEVATEALVVAIADGKVDAARFIDPALGFLEHVILPGGDEKPEPEIKQRRCGAKAVAAAKRYAATYVAEQTRGRQFASYDPDHQIQCSNEFVATADPDWGARYAVCSSDGAAEWDAAYEMVWMPDAERGLRLVGVLVWEVGVNEVPWAWFVAEAAKTGKLCR